MSVIVERVAGLMGSTSCSILMTDEKMREGVVVAAHENHEIDMLSVDLEKYPEIRRAVETREPVVIQDVRSDPTIAAVRETLLAKGYQSALVIPLVFGSEVMGALFLRTKRTTPFDEREIRFCKVVAGASANALKNALLYQEMTLQAERHRTIGETLRCILNATPDLILATDAAGQVTEVNNGAENLLGLDRVDIDGHTVREVLALDEEQNIGHPVHVDGGIEQRETMILRESGGTLEMHVLQAPLRDAEGARAGDVWIGRDISRLRKTERSLAQAERLSSLGEIVAGVAHELNNPLSGVVGYAELLQGTVSEENVLHDLERIVESSRRCQKIVMNLLSFSRKHKAEKARHDLNYCVEKVLELKEYHLRANTILPVLELEAQLPSTRFDFHQIEQVVLNLIQNAEQAIRSTGNGGSIAMRTYQEGDYLVLEVEDDGPGIEDEVRDRVFDPFFTTKDIGEGTGLGLSVSFGIVQEHGGELELAESEEGKGACFRLRLPWVRPAENELDNQPAGLEDGDCTPLYGARILIVDDEEVIRELMFRVLREHGARVQVAGDGLEAWELIAQQEFDLVVTDIRMPNLDGQSLYERVVEVRPELMSRFVFSTGDTIRPETMEFLENVHNRILTKPLQPETVRQVLSRALES
jgi:PAS domain S-box-containing protein